MKPEDFEQKLMELIDEALGAGVSRSEVISVLELRQMAMEEEEA